ncbi:hypothetical protein [Streptomyces sp. NPDC002088]|uniref:VMAP-C domain-containing protein n=1 Tax=Streptomyces sp. NPDC002088 TaxID=3154665 RepID=UPI0033321981
MTVHQSSLPEEGDHRWNRWPQSALDRLRDAICAFSDALVDRSFLIRLIKHTNRHLQQWDITFTVAHCENPRDFVAELVSTLDGHAERERVLLSLRNSFEFFRGEERAMLALDSAVEELAPTGKLSSHWRELVVWCLRQTGAEISRPLVVEAVERALRPGEVAPLRGTESLPSIIHRLSDPLDNRILDTNAAAGSGPEFTPPLVLRFLSELAPALPDTKREGLRVLIELAADELQLPDLQRNHLLRRDRVPAVHVDARVLQIRLQETVPGSNEYFLEGVVYDRTHNGLRNPRKREAEHPISLKHLKDTGRTCLANWHDLADWLDHADRSHVEFLLPWSLLGHPVDHWLTDGHEYPVGHKYPVVVRSLDRLEQPSWHSYWKSRWRLLMSGTSQSGSDQAIGWLALNAEDTFQPRGSVLQLRGVRGEVRAWLDEHPENTGLGLAFAYEPADDRRSVGFREAVREGVPFVVWRRDGGDPQELAERLAALSAESLFDLPYQIRRWRRAALDDDLGDLRNHLTLLWDNPECTYTCAPMSAPSAGKPSS